MTTQERIQSLLQVHENLTADEIAGILRDGTWKLGVPAKLQADFRAALIGAGLRASGARPAIEAAIPYDSNDPATWSTGEIAS